jgi:hypothetical protein
VSLSPDHPSGATGPRRLALVLSGGYLFVAGALGAVLLVTSGEDAAPASFPAADTTGDWQPGDYQAGLGSELTTSTTRTATSTTTTSTSTATTSTEPSGFQQVVSQAGMSTVVPAGWPVRSCASGNGCEQSDDPADSDRFLRFGGSPAPTVDLAVQQTSYERDFAKRPGYRRLVFQPGFHHGSPSVDWEFEWTSNGVRRHVHAMYWRANGDDNFVYASSTADRWAETADIYQAMLTTSTP